MHRLAWLAGLFVVACSSGETLEARLKPMVGAAEPALLAAMGRPPDARSAPAPDVTLLQWRWQRAYAIPDRMLGYSYAGGTIRPIPHTPEGIVRDECLAEWTVERGIATRYRFQGNDCWAAATEIAGQGRP
jgi:hypothetical protein